MKTLVTSSMSEAPKPERRQDHGTRGQRLGRALMETYPIMDKYLQVKDTAHLASHLEIVALDSAPEEIEVVYHADGDEYEDHDLIDDLGNYHPDWVAGRHGESRFDEDADLSDLALGLERDYNGDGFIDGPDPYGEFASEFKQALGASGHYHADAERLYQGTTDDDPADYLAGFHIKDRP